MKVRYVKFPGTLLVVSVMLFTLSREVLAVAPPSLEIDSLSSTPASVDEIVPIIVNTLLTFAGIISVIMIIVGGIMYTLSAGDSGKTTKAKDTILYSVIGLVITMLAYAIVNFVIKTF